MVSSKESSVHPSTGLPNPVASEGILGNKFTNSGRIPGVGPTQQARSREVSKEAAAFKKDEESDSDYHDQDAIQLSYFRSKWPMVLVLVIVLFSVSAAIVLACVYGRDSKSWNSMQQSCVLEKQQLAIYLKQQENACKLREREAESAWEQREIAWNQREREIESSWAQREIAWIQRERETEIVWKQREQETESAWEQREQETENAWKQREQDRENAHEKIINEWLAREEQWNIERFSLVSAIQDPSTLSAKSLSL